MVTDGNEAFGGKHDIVHTDVELQYCTPETSIIL